MAHKLAMASTEQLDKVAPLERDNLDGMPGTSLSNGDAEGDAGSLPLHLAELVPQLRHRLGLGPDLADEEILESLVAITQRSEPRARWLTAFNSPLGHWLALRGSDLNTALSMTLAKLPAPRS